jgi:hypothetical protein
MFGSGFHIAIVAEVEAALALKPRLAGVQKLYLHVILSVVSPVHRSEFVSPISMTYCQLFMNYSMTL